MLSVKCDNYDLFLPPLSQINIFFFWFSPFSLLPHSHLILPPPSLPPLSCFVSPRFFHCHIVPLQMQHTFCQWSLCSGWKPRRPCPADCQAAGDQSFLSFQLLLKQHWLVSLAAAEKAGTREQQIQHVLLAYFQQIRQCQNRDWEQFDAACSAIPLSLLKQQPLPLPFYPLFSFFFLLSIYSFALPHLSAAHFSSYSFSRTLQTTFFSCAAPAAAFRQLMSRPGCAALWGRAQPLTQPQWLKRCKWNGVMSASFVISIKDKTKVY